jgi:hypothetical protein
MFEAEWRYVEMFLASRGAVVAVIDDDPELERRFRVGHAVRYESHEIPDIIGAARSAEAFAGPLREWKQYIGTIRPERLIICAPDRLTRLMVIGDLDEDEWPSVGITSSTSSKTALDRLWGILGNPKLVGYGHLPGDVENWIERHDGVFSGIGASRAST